MRLAPNRDKAEPTSGSEPRPTRRTFVSGRTAIVLSLAVIAVILLALPMREYLRARTEISNAAREQAEQQARVDELQHKVDQWNDPDFVRQQARERLNFLLPGEVGYEVIDPKAPDDKLAEKPAAVEPPTGPWYDRLWRSVRAADRGARNE